jgi:hypothetical protein
VKGYRIIIRGTTRDASLHERLRKASRVGSIVSAGAPLVLGEPPTIRERSGPCGDCMAGTDFARSPIEN